MAAINFPTATADGQTFEADTGVIYTYNGTPPNGFWSGSFQTTGIDALDAKYILKDDSGSVQTIKRSGLKINDNSNDTILLNSDGSATFAGKVGIGTTSPGSFNSDGNNLVVGTGSGGQGMSIYSGTSNYGTIYFADGTSSDALYRGGILYNHNSDFMRFDTAAGERMRIDSSGNLGIGVTNPADKLQVNGSGTTAGDGAIVARFYDSVQSKGLFLGYDSNEVGGTIYGANLLTFQTYNGTSWGERMRISTDGNLSVGTSTTNQAKLHVENGSFSTIFKVSSAGAQTAYGIYQNSATGFGTSDGYFVGVGTDGTGYVWNYENLGLGFGTNNTERMRIDSSGNMGLGVNSPSSRLHVKGAADSYLTLQAGTTDGNDGVLFQNSAGTQKGALLYDTDDNYLLFNVNSGERMRIDSSGNVGIGDSSPSYKLDVSVATNDPTTGSPAAGSFVQIAGGTTTVGNGPSVVLSNASGAKETFWRMSAVTASGNNGDLVFNGYNGGTNYPERLRITAAGNVGIGTTSASANLHVVSSGATEIKSESTGDNALISINNSSSVPWILTQRSDTSNGFSFRYAGNNYVNIDTSGRVGIGATSVDELLHIESSDTTVRLKVESTATNSYPGVRFTNDARTYDLQIDGATDALRIYDATASTERLRIDSSGRVGINTSSPGFPLDVQSDAGSTNGIRIRGGSGNIGKLSFDTSAGTFEYGYLESGSGFLRFGYNGTEQMRIDSSGNLNFSQEASSNYPEQKLKWSNDSTTTNGFYISQDTNRNGRIWHEQGLDIIFGTTNTERMRIDSSGNLNLNSTGAKTLLVGSTNSASATLILDGDSNGDGAGADYAYLQHTTAGDLDIANLKSRPIRFYTNGTERMAVENNGQVSISHNSSGVAALYLNATDSAYSTNVQQNRVSRTANSGFVFLSCRTNGGADIEFNLRGDGNAYADGSWNGGGADYAEFFEWSDGNASAEDRRGISVVLDGNKIREATAGEEPIGVISGNPSVVGDADMERWKGKYLRDEYGTYDLDENGDRKLNPDYDSNAEYVSRENRPEWDTVGLMGKIRIRKGQVTGSRWIKMRDINDSVEEWLVR